MQFFTSWKRVADGDLPEHGASCLIIRNGVYKVVLFLRKPDPMWVIDMRTWVCEASDLWMELPLEKDVCALFD